MNVLLIDIGNTRIKWARFDGKRLGPQQAAVHSGWGGEDYARRVFLSDGRAPGVLESKGLASESHLSGRQARVPSAEARALGREGRGSVRGAHGSAANARGSIRGAHESVAKAHESIRGANQSVAKTRGLARATRGPARVSQRPSAASGFDRVLVVSVAGERVERSVRLAARRAGAPAPEFVTSQRSAGGVTSGYPDPWRLGVDRFVAAIGAFHLAKGRPVCVVGVGTAMTIDLVDGKGRHRGGAIIPAPTLMVDTLLRNTDGIRRRAEGGAAAGKSLFGRSTRAALVQGSRYAAAALIDRAVDEARALVRGSSPLVMLTGGGAPSVKPLVRSACVSVPDLVLRGLAALCT